MPLSNLNESELRDANLRNAWLAATTLEKANLEGADLNGANFDSAQMEGCIVTPKQLKTTESLSDAILPDGTKLSEDNWKAEFEEWCEKQENPENE